LLAQFQCAAVVVHHTKKPSGKAESTGMLFGEGAYLGAGSIEWANWSRPVPNPPSTQPSRPNASHAPPPPPRQSPATHSDPTVGSAVPVSVPFHPTVWTSIPSIAPGHTPGFPIPIPRSIRSTGYPSAPDEPGFPCIPVAPAGVLLGSGHRNRPQQFPSAASQEMPPPLDTPATNSTDIPLTPANASAPTRLQDPPRQSLATAIAVFCLVPAALRARDSDAHSAPPPPPHVDPRSPSPYTSPGRHARTGDSPS
jgi:hypothetical protein